MENMSTTQEYRNKVNEMGKKEFTLLKMQEYGFWPRDLPTPYERQSNETPEEYENRKKLLDEYQYIAKKLSTMYEDRAEIEKKLRRLKSQYAQTWDYEKLRKDVTKEIMRESIERRSKIKRQRELLKEQRTQDWNKQKAENIVFIGKGYSSALSDKATDEEKLNSLGIPIIEDDKALAEFLGLEYKQLRFLTYHRDVVISDHYYRFQIPKKSGGQRKIAAPKTILKNSQRKILSGILEKIDISGSAHGFYKGRSVLTGAQVHKNQPKLLINMDLENFFPTITFQRVRGMFKAFGYSGYISSLLAMICTYCERMPIEIKGQVKYVKTSDRILPQGSPASPMITNILCRRMDKTMNELAEKYNFSYSRYADDMSFCFYSDLDEKRLKKIAYEIQIAVHSEGLWINKEKTRYLRPSNRQCITGVVMNNEKPGVPKVWVRRMRAALHNAKKLKESGKLTASLVNEISGMAAWLKTIDPNRYSILIAETKKITDDYKNV